VPLGHFYNVLVILSVQHIVSELLCAKQARSANHITRYVSRPSNWFLYTNVFCLSARNSEKSI
jgi:hypothetical protein